MRTAAAAALTVAYRRQQFALRAAALRDLQTLWPSFDGGYDSWQGFARLATTLVQGRNRDAAAIAGRYFVDFRVAEGVGGTAAIRMAAVPSAELLGSSFASTGLAGTLRALSVGMSLEAARANGFVRLAAAGGRHVMNGGRQTIVASTGADPRARGWTRLTSGSPCEFCEMLAGRGAVYGADTAEFQAHDGCACTAEPSY